MFKAAAMWIQPQLPAATMDGAQTDSQHSSKTTDAARIKYGLGSGCGDFPAEQNNSLTGTNSSKLSNGNQCMVT